MSKNLTEAKRKAIQKYDSVNTKQYHLKLNIKTDADIIDRLGQEENVQGYIKELIRADIKSRIVGHWLPGCVVKYEKAYTPWDGEYSYPVYGACKEGQAACVAICSECGSVFNLDAADDFCPECNSYMIPWADNA